MPSKTIYIVIITGALLGASAPAFGGNNVRSYFDTDEPAKPLSSSVSQTAPLQGGIKSETMINPSLRVIPALQGRAGSQINYGQMQKPSVDTYVPEQIRGSVHTGGSLNGGLDDGPAMFLGGRAAGSPGGQSGVIPPISTYHRTPATGVINYIPGMDITSTSAGGSATTQSGVSQYKTVGRGITVLNPDLAVSTQPLPPSVGLLSSGIWPGLKGTPEMLQATPVQMITPGTNTLASVHSDWRTHQESGYKTSHGITTAPGFEVTITPPGMTQETLGGRWSTNPPLPRGLSAVPGVLQLPKTFTRITPITESGRGTVFTQAQPTRLCTDWPQWYREVGKTIYTRWQTANVCPGAAKMEVTVMADHNISARVLDYTAAPDMARDIPMETQFRETAVQIVNHIGFFEIPDFPSPGTDKVVFEIDLKRSVDGPTGVSFVGMPSK